MNDLAQLVANLDKPESELAAMKEQIKGAALPIKPLGFRVIVKMDDVKMTQEIEMADGSKKDLQLYSPTEAKREQGALSKGWILAFGPLAYKGFHGSDGPEDWGVEVGDYVEFKSYDGILSAFDESRTIRIVNDSDIVCKVEV